MTPNQTVAELKEQLRARFLGKTLYEVPTPSVVLDLAKVEVNCERMLDATERIGLLWRAHIKSHKVSTTSFYFLFYFSDFIQFYHYYSGQNVNKARYCK